MSTKTCLFLDWCPVPTAPWYNHAFDKVTLPLERQNLLDPKNRLPASVDYWMRTDGIFVFRIEVSMEDGVDEGANRATPDVQLERNRQIVKIAKVASLQIKKSHGQTTAQAFSMLISDRWKDRRTFNSISTTPIKLKLEGREDILDKNIEKKISDPSELLKLRSMALGSMLNTEAPALLLMRSQFSKCLDAALVAAREIKYKPVYLPWFRLNLFRPSIKFRWVGIEWKRGTNLIILFLLINFFTVPYLAYSNSKFDTELILNLDVGKVGEALKNTASGLAAVFFSIHLFLDVFLKRRPCIKAMNRAQSVLSAGNLYCTVVTNLVDRAKKPEASSETGLFQRIVANGDFSESINTLEVHKEREYSKQSLTIRVFVPLIFLSLIPLSLLLENNDPDAYDSINRVLAPVGLKLPSKSP